jgi:TolB-like protein
MPDVGSLIRFGSFEVDPQAGELRKQGLRIKLREQPFKILTLLLARPGQVVSRDELQKKLWPPDTFVDFDRALNKAINHLREALCDSAESPRFIETLPKRGYRFIASVDNGQPPQSEAVDGINSVAVLPFANLSADPENQYFGDGLAEEILNGLARLQGLRVVARTSSFAFRGKEQDIREIGRVLKVGVILEGSLRRAGDRIRISVQLVSTNDGYHLWSESYDREMTDVFAIQEEIAQAVVRALKLRFASRPGGALVRPGTANLDAYNAYLEGCHYARELTDAGLARSRACHERAVALDPHFARAYVGLAEYYYFLAFFRHARPHDVMPHALSFVERALELDPECAEAYSLRGALRAAYEYNWTEAGKDFDRALALNAGLASAHRRRGTWYLRALGRLQEAAAEIKTAIDLDPLAPWPRSSEPYVLYLLGQKSEAVQRAREVLELFPAYWFGYMMAGIALGGCGLHTEGAAVIEKGLTIDPGNTCLLAIRSLIYQQEGHPAEARRILRELEEIGRTQYTSPAALYIASAACGDFDHCYHWLHKGVDERDILTAMILPRRLKIPGHQSDPRYLALLRKLNLEKNEVGNE